MAFLKGGWPIRNLLRLLVKRNAWCASAWIGHSASNTPRIRTLRRVKALLAVLETRRATRGFGLRPASCDEEFETSNNLLTAKHVDDMNVACTEDTVDKYVKCVADTFGKCKLNKHTSTNCAVIYTKDEGGNVTLDQDEYIKQLRPIQHRELTGAGADAQAAKTVADMFVSLRGALAYALIAQAWLMVFVVCLQRVQEPTNIQVRRLSAIARKLQACPKKIVYQAMTPCGRGRPAQRLRIPTPEWRRR
eukprot:9376645-Pyramimonas_sp.AAC.1